MVHSLLNTRICFPKIWLALLAVNNSHSVGTNQPIMYYIRVFNPYWISIGWHTLWLSVFYWLVIEIQWPVFFNYLGCVHICFVCYLLHIYFILTSCHHILHTFFVKMWFSLKLFIWIICIEREMKFTSLIQLIDIC